MSTNKTENYQLHAWELGDDFLLSEINANFAAIDGALARMVAAGAYIGDGEAERFIPLGFTPRVVLVLPADQFTCGSYSRYGGLAVPDHPVAKEERVMVQITENGFLAYHYFSSGGNYSSTYTANKKNTEFHFLAVR